MKKPIVFHTTHRAKFSEVDPYGHVNTQHYLAYFLDHRFTGCRENLGLDLKEIGKLPILFPTTSVTIDFKRPILGDEEFSIESKVVEVSEQKCIVECSMTKSNKDIASTCRFEFTCVDKKTGKTTPWPAGFIDRFFIT